MATQVSLNSGAVASAGALALQTNGTTEAVSISTGQVATLAQNPILTSGTANGVAYLNGSKAVTSGSALTFDGTNFATTGTASATKMIPTGGSATGNGMYLPASNTLAWSNNGSETMRLDSAGNLGLGVTPSANAGVSTLNIANYNRTFSALTMGSNANSAGYVGYNMGNTSTSNTWKYISADTGSALYFAGNEMRFMQFASGSAGATTSGTQAMTLDASGNLGVGTTSPDCRIHAQGTTDGIYARVKNTAGTSARIAFESSGVASASIGIPSGTSALAFYLASESTERARIDSSGNFIQKGATTASGIKPSALGNNESISTVNSATYTVTLGTSAKLFWISLGNGDAALVFTSYLSSSITFLGITPTNIVASASPTSAQLGISKSANSHDIVIKTGSALASTAAAWQMGVLSSGVS